METVEDFESKRVKRRLSIRKIQCETYRTTGIPEADWQTMESFEKQFDKHFDNGTLDDFEEIVQKIVSEKKIRF